MRKKILSLLVIAYLSANLTAQENLPLIKLNILGKYSAPKDIAFSNDYKYAVIVGDNIDVWMLPDGKQVKQFTHVLENENQSAGFSPKNDSMIVIQKVKKSCEVKIIRTSDWAMAEKENKKIRGARYKDETDTLWKRLHAMPQFSEFKSHFIPYNDQNGPLKYSGKDYSLEYQNHVLTINYSGKVINPDIDASSEVIGLSENGRYLIINQYSTEGRIINAIDILKFISGQNK